MPLRPGRHRRAPRRPKTKTRDARRGWSGRRWTKPWQRGLRSGASVPGHFGLTGKVKMTKKGGCVACEAAADRRGSGGTGYGHVCGRVYGHVYGRVHGVSVDVRMDMWLG